MCTCLGVRSLSSPYVATTFCAKKYWCPHCKNFKVFSHLENYNFKVLRIRTSGQTSSVACFCRVHFSFVLGHFGTIAACCVNVP